MKRTKEKISSLLNAITFAEAGEHETAKEYLENISNSAEALGKKVRADTHRDETHKKGLREKLQEHMAAVAFAEVGEHHIAASMTHAETRPQAVLFVIDGDAPDSNAFSYAVSLCKRMSLEMDILQVTGIRTKKSRSGSSGVDHDGAAERVRALSRQLEQEGIPFKTTVRRGDPNQLLFDYAQRHKDVFMVIYDTPRAKEKSLEGKMWQKIVDGISRRLSIPLVTVTGKQSTPQAT